MWQRAGFQFRNFNELPTLLKFVAQLGIDIVRQGFEAKLPTAENLAKSMNLGLDEICYIGDDLTDLPVIRSVGLGVAVSDAAPELLETADLVTEKAGGHGAVRELIEQILRSTGRWDDLVQQYYSN